MSRYIVHLMTLFFFLGSSLALGQTRYISDELLVPLRKGQGTQFGILHKGLPSGSVVTLLDFNQESGWSKVQTSGGQVGWLPARYLVKEPPAKVVLDRSINELATLKEKYQQLQTTSDELAAELKATQETLKAETQRANKAVQDYQALKQISSDAVKNREMVDQLAAKKVELDTQLSQLTTQVDRLTESERNQFFIYGALAVLLGCLLAIILPRLKPTKRNSEWM